MKSRTLLATAIGGAMLVGSSAYALPPSDYTAAPAPLDIYYSGATATDTALENAFLETTAGVCAPGTIDIYRITATNRGNRVTFCRVTAAQVPGFPASNIVGGVETGGTKVAFHKESIGGSSNAIIPLADQTPLEFLNMNTIAGNGGSTCAQSDQNVGSTTLRQYHQWNACADVTELKVPNGGISDTETNLGFPTPTAAQLAKLTSARGVAVPFGIAVSLNLYKALQTVQGLPVNDTSTANVPSLTRAQIRGLLTGRLNQWSLLRDSSNTPITSAPGVTPPTNPGGTASATAVFVCRRVNSSGTEAATEAYWLQGRCDSKNGSTGAGVIVGGQGSTMDVGVAPNFTSTVTPSEGSGDLRSCLNAHHTNGTWAIGFMALDVKATDVTNFRLIRIDGALPNLASVANGDYDWFAEDHLNRVQPGLPGEVTGQALTLIQYLESNIGKPSLLALGNSANQNAPHGDGGVMALSTFSGVTFNNPPVVDGPGGAMRTNPVNPLTRTLVGTTKTNTCNPASTAPGRAFVTP